MISELISAVMGIILGVILNDPISKAYLFLKKKIIKYYYKFIRKKAKTAGSGSMDTHGNFIFGNRQTSIHILDGDGHREYQPENMQFDIVDKEPDFGMMKNEVEYFHSITVKEIEEKAKNGENIPWNGDTLSLRKYAISRTPNSEEFRIRLELVINPYYYTYAAIMHLNDPCPDTGKTLKQYIDEYSFEAVGSYVLPNSVGMIIQVVTKDGYTFFSRRSDVSGFRPGESDVSIVEGLSDQDIINHTLALDKAMIRAFQEEICDVDDRDNEITPSVLGFAFDRQYNQWNIIGVIHCTLSCEEIIRRNASGLSGGWELKLEPVLFDIEHTMQYLSTHKMWDMGIVTLYLSLVNDGNSRNRIDKYILKHLQTRST